MYFYHILRGARGRTLGRWNVKKGQMGIKKDKQGVALAYTVMITLLVFAMCALIATALLVRVEYAKFNYDRAKTQGDCAQIGELFWATHGDFSFDTADPSRLTLGKALQACGFSVDQREDGTRVAVRDEDIYVLNFSDGDVTRLTVSAGGKTCLCVGLDAAGNIAEWTNG